MNIGIIGYGYWGKILHKNINNLNLNLNIHISDPKLNLNPDIDLLKCDKIIISTPADTHRELVDLYLSNGIEVFCEKPLALKRTDVHALYKIASDNNTKLFVDWTFTFNDAINFIKTEYLNNKFGKIKSARMTRINKGPERYDVCAKWDLSSHDVSILEYIFGETCSFANWNCFKRNNNSAQNDTCFGLIQYKNFDALLYSSWEYSIKDRMCIFEFENGILTWDDINGQVTFNGEILNYTKTKSPLIKSIETFLSGNYDQKQLTINTTNILLMEN